MRFILLLIALLGLSARATTYHVKPAASGGSDAANGLTVGTAWATGQHAANVMVAGDTCLFEAGTYNENFRTDSHAGSSGNYITFDGQNVASIGSFTLEKPYIRVINFPAVTDKSVFNGKVYVNQIANFCVVSNNVFDCAFDSSISPVWKWNGADAAPFGNAGSDNLFISNVVKNIRGEMVVRLNGYRNVITGNRLLDSDNTDWFQVAGGTNYIVNNLCSNIFQSGLNSGNHADFVQTFGLAGGTFQGTKGHIIESNIVVKIDGEGQLGNLTDDGYAFATDMIWRNNLFIGVSAKISIAFPNVKFYNNTFIDCSTNSVNGGAILIWGDVPGIGNGSGGQCFNNAFLNCGLPGNTNNNNGWYSFDTTLTGVAADYNYVAKFIGGQYKAVIIDASHRAVGAGGGWDKLSWWEPNGINGPVKVVGGSTSTIDSDPRFVNPAQLDYRLNVGSPLISAALSQASSFTTDIRGVTRGGTWDIGAYEFQQSDFNVYPNDVSNRVINAYCTVVSNATTIIIPPNPVRLEATIERRTFTNRPSAWVLWTNLYTLNSAAVTNSISFTDTNIAGVHYEYRISQLIQTNTIFGDANGYRDYQIIDTGYRVPLIDTRGYVSLLVESNINAALPTEIDRLKFDLIGAGYKVLPHTNIISVEATAGTSWTNAVWATKQLIATDYATDTNGPWAVLIVGHVPVPYSGTTLSPGSHTDNIGAHGTDLFYADVNGTFTDSTANVTSADAVFTRNVPGDGKFDQDNIPSTPEIAIGRVDIGRNMPAFSLTATQAIQQYLDRDHDWRHKLFSVRPKAMTYYGGNTNLSVDGKPLEGHNLIAGYFGNSTSMDLGDWLDLASTTNNSYLFALENGAGHIDESVQLGTSFDFASNPLYAVFTSTYGSYYGSWDSLNTNAFLKSILMNSGYPLTTSYRENYMQIGASAMNEPIGYEEFASQSQFAFVGSGKDYTWYIRVVPFVGNSTVNFATKMFEELHGDPTLLTRQVEPVTNLTVNVSGADNVLTWTAPATESNVQGYHVYRAPAADLNSFTRLTSVPVTSTGYTNTGAAGTGYTYQVRTVKLEDSVNRSFYSASQGVFVDAFGIGGGGTPGNARVVMSGNVQSTGKVTHQ